MNLDTFVILLPPFIVLLGSILILLSSMFLSGRLLILIVFLIFIAAILASIINMTTQVTDLFFHDTYLHSSFGSMIEIFFAISGFIVIAFSYFAYNMRQQKLLFGDYAALTMAVLGSAMILVHSVDLILVFVALETIAICQYILVSLPRTQMAATSSIKYLLNGAIATAIFTFGLVFLWGATASTSIIEISKIAFVLEGNSISIILFSVIFMTAGIAFKMGLMPFHSWLPDVYYGGPFNVIAFLSVISKGTAFLFFGFFGFLIVNQNTSDFSIWWSILIAFFAILSMTLGNVAALQADNVKKILAFSSIAHAGYFGIGIVAILLGNNIGLSAIALYLVAYGFANLLVFFICALNSQSENNFDIQSFSGLFYKNKLLAILLTIGLLSLTGIPPFAGFIGKFYLFYSVFNADYWWTWAIIIFAVSNTVISAGYYFRWIKIIFTENPDQKIITLPIDAAKYINIILILLAIFIILIGIFPDVVVSHASDMFSELGLLIGQ